MKISYDPAKNARNIAERGLPFEMVQLINRNTAFTWQDVRHDYGEERFAMLGESKADYTTWYSAFGAKLSG